MTKNLFEPIINNWKNSRGLKASKSGKIYGWEIEWEGTIIGELVAYEYQDMFWDSYTILSKDKKWEAYLFEEELWNQSAFKFKNKYYKVYAQNAFSANTIDLKDRQTILMRGLYI